MKPGVKEFQQPRSSYILIFTVALLVTLLHFQQPCLWDRFLKEYFFTSLQHWQHTYLQHRHPHPPRLTPQKRRRILRFHCNSSLAGGSAIGSSFFTIIQNASPGAQILSHGRACLLGIMLHCSERTWSPWHVPAAQLLLTLLPQQQRLLRHKYHTPKPKSGNQDCMDFSENRERGIRIKRFLLLYWLKGKAHTKKSTNLIYHSRILLSESEMVPIVYQTFSTHSSQFCNLSALTYNKTKFRSPWIISWGAYCQQITKKVFQCISAVFHLNVWQKTWMKLWVVLKTK